MDLTLLREALELAAGSRIIRKPFGPTNATNHDIAITKKNIRLFLESLPGEFSIAELCAALDELDDE